MAPPKVIMETDRLRLRTWSHADADVFDETCNTTKVMRWLGAVQKPRELNDDVQYFIDSYVEDGHTFWVVERRSDDTFLGFCGFVTVPDEDSTVEGELEIGWRIRADMWRKGYAEEAARASIAWAEVNTGAPRIVSRTAERNQASRALMAKLGMRHEPSLDCYPEEEDGLLVVYTRQLGCPGRAS